MFFREANERLERLNESVGEAEGGEPMGFLCECGDETCAERIELTREEYERARSDPTLFVILPGHEQGAVEEVVEQADRYHIVRKRAGEPAQMAKDLDPRP